MKRDGKQVTRNATWAIGQTIISAFVLFFLYRFLLKELGAAKLGLWSLILASTSLARLGELGFSNATLRFVGKYVGAGQAGDAAEILETALLSISVPFMLLVVIAIPLIGEALPWFIPEQHMAEALVIVPWSMFALWLSVTTGLVQSALDGCGRMDQRNIVLIGTNLLYLVIALWLTPMLGLKGVAIAQAIQAGVSLLIIWWLTKRTLRQLPLLPWRWHKNRFQEIFSFAVSMQISSITGMMIEPLVKALISRFGGLEFLAYYEMANQVVVRARGVLMGGFQALLPVYAASNADNLEGLRKLNRMTQLRVSTLGVPYLTMLAAAFPIISNVWTGTEQSILINCGVIISLTWLIAASAIPSHFFAVGTGRGWIVARNQILILALTGLLGYPFGYRFGGYGVVFGALLAFLISTIYLQITVTSIFKAIPKKINSREDEFNSPISIYGLSVVAGIILLSIHELLSIYIYIVSFFVMLAALSVISYRVDKKNKTEIKV